jgi:hypothetical protein
MDYILSQMNWDLLREQKAWLLRQQPCAEVDGIVNLIDAIQDLAVSTEQASEVTVFGYRDGMDY